MSIKEESEKGNNAFIIEESTAVSCIGMYRIMSSLQVSGIVIAAGLEQKAY